MGKIEKRDRLVFKSTFICLDVHFANGADSLTYRDHLKSVQILLSRTQAGPGRKVQQEQDRQSRKEILATMYHLFSRSLYIWTVVAVYIPAKALFAVSKKKICFKLFNRAEWSVGTYLLQQISIHKKHVYSYAIGVLSISENCQKTVRKLSENCQKTVKSVFLMVF